MEEKFAVAFGAQDWGFGGLDRIAAQVFNGARDFFHCGFVNAWIADNSSFADLLASSLELRLDQDNDLELPR